MKAYVLHAMVGALLVPALSVYASIVGSEPPDPNPGIDPKLFSSVTPQEFFKARAEDPALEECRGQLADSRAQFRTKKEETGRLQAQSQTLSETQKDEVDQLEDEAVRIRKRMLPLIQKCGECVTAPMEAPLEFSKPGHPRKVWYMADGSCQLTQNQQAAFQNISGSLLQLHRYAKNRGGFYNILSFIGLDGEKGPINNEMNEITSSPFYAFIAVRGPKLPELLGGPLYFSYYFKNEYKKNDEELVLTYRSYPGLEEQPEVLDIRASGRSRRLNKFPIQDVKGMWYVNHDGYLRYQTSGNFGKKVPFASEMAESTLLETLVETAERGM